MEERVKKWKEALKEGEGWAEEDGWMWRMKSVEKEEQEARGRARADEEEEE